MSTPTSRARGVPTALSVGAGAAWGGALLGVPGALVHRLTGRRADEAETVVARVLGARQLLQAAAVGRWPHRAGRIGAVADGLHALSMVALAVARPRYRRPALASAAVAVGLSALERRAG